MTIKSAKDLVAKANDMVDSLSGEDAAKLLHDPGVVFVDVREKEELERTGKVEGAVHVPRGLLEFQADPASPMHKPELEGDKRLVLYCGSGSRSALAARSLKEMGFADIAHVTGGFAALEKAGAPTTRP